MKAIREEPEWAASRKERQKEGIDGERLVEEGLKGMEALGMRGELIWCFQKNAPFVTEENVKSLPPEDVEEFDYRCREYHALNLWLNGGKTLYRQGAYRPPKDFKLWRMEESKLEEIRQEIFEEAGEEGETLEEFWKRYPMELDFVEESDYEYEPTREDRKTDWVEEIVVKKAEIKGRGRRIWIGKQLHKRGYREEDIYPFTELGDWDPENGEWEMLKNGYTSLMRFIEYMTPQKLKAEFPVHQMVFTWRESAQLALDELAEKELGLDWEDEVYARLTKAVDRAEWMESSFTKWKPEQIHRFRDYQLMDEPAIGRRMPSEFDPIVWKREAFEAAMESLGYFENDDALIVETLYSAFPRQQLWLLDEDITVISDSGEECTGGKHLVTIDLDSKETERMDGSRMMELVRHFHPKDEEDKSPSTMMILAGLNFMKQTIASPEIRQPMSKSAKRHAKKELGYVPEYSIMTLRAYAPSSSNGDGTREYNHRWKVRGHWRKQAFGPGRRRRKLTYIHEHWKGPEDAPLVPKKHSARVTR